MKNFDSLKVEDKLICVNDEDWGSCFKKGGVYTVTELWGTWDTNIALDNINVAREFAEDFELYKEDVQ